MDRQKDNLVLKGMNNVHSRQGLGILLGAGRISANTHEQILALLNDDDMESGASGEAASREEPKRPIPALGVVTTTMQSRLIRTRQCRSLICSMASTPSRRERQTRPQPHGPPSNSTIVCPWFLTPGFRCRDQEKGRCAWAHEEIPNGTTDPLICHFWAENRCTKADSECKFAHYWAQHRQFAPLPGGSKWKKEKGSKTSSSDVW
ncbi:hypothetical protein PG987_007460 [Apiospora arundinis]